MLTDSLIIALKEGDWLSVIVLSIVIISTLIILLRRFRKNITNLQKIPQQLKEVAQELSGRYSGYGIFGRRPSVRGTYKDMPVRIDFPIHTGKNNRFSLFNSEHHCPVWFRIRFRLPTGLWLRIRPQDAQAQLLQLGVSPDVLSQKSFRSHLRELFGSEEARLFIRGRTATYRVPIDWSAENVTSWHVLNVVESFHVVLIELLQALSGKQAPLCEKILVWLPETVALLVEFFRRHMRKPHTI